MRLHIIFLPSFLLIPLLASPQAPLSPPILADTSWEDEAAHNTPPFLPPHPLAPPAPAPFAVPPRGRSQLNSAPPSGSRSPRIFWLERRGSGFSRCCLSGC